jgi:hypothetical protein
LAQWMKSKNFRKGNLHEYHHNNIMREKYVYQKVLENKHLFTKAELNHADWYYVKQLRDAMADGVETISDYLVK